MSTTFDIIPVETIEITFGEVLSLAELRINQFIQGYGVKHYFTLEANLHHNEERYVKKVDEDSRFEWNDSEYIWFNIKGVIGGSDSYCREILETDIDPDDPWWWLDHVFYSKEGSKKIEIQKELIKENNKYWSLRRSVGQPAIINMAYGFIAAAIAELTKGYIFTDDGAWNYKLFPATFEEFLQFYFKPELEINESSGEWAERCIQIIKSEYC